MDLVVANISPGAIIELAPDFLRVLRPGGVILASGFEVHEVEQVQKARRRVKCGRKANGH